MTSRLFWKLICSFALVHLIAVLIITRLASRPSEPGQLQLYTMQDGRESLRPLVNEGNIRFDLPAEGEYALELRSSGATTPMNASTELQPGSYPPGDCAGRAQIGNANVGLRGVRHCGTTARYALDGEEHCRIDPQTHDVSGPDGGGSI